MNIRSQTFNRLSLLAVALLPAVAAARDDAAHSVVLFREAGRVLRHPRCLNCHPAADRPTQTDAMRPHQPRIVRGGEDGRGPPGLSCSTCHPVANFDPARMPGHPDWHLAPRSMAWQGLSLGQICAQLKDPVRNGGRDLPALLRHVSEDSLVGWGWSPGIGRTPAPGTQAEFGATMRAWVDSGAHCPPE
jgi:hypothetical protein